MNRLEWSLTFLIIFVAGAVAGLWLASHADDGRYELFSKKYVCMEEFR